MKNVNVAKSRLSVGYTNNDQSLLNFWNKNKVFSETNQRLNQNVSNKPFVLLDGPPYANGEAHLGHGLNKLLKDLVLKSRWFMGQPVFYQPGWDCHGLPLELAVEKKLGKLEEKELKKHCKNLAFRSLVKQRKSFKRLGVLGDWDNPYVTLSDNMLKNTWDTLSVLSSKNLLEYKQFPVHYCPACQSSLAEAELEQKMLVKSSLYFTAVLVNNAQSLKKESVLVWTTTPWTLPMNQGFAYNPEFKYEVWGNDTEVVYLQNSSVVEQWLVDNNYKFSHEVKGDLFQGKEAYSPLTKNVVKFMPALWVEEGKTGFVHTACSHGPEDYELGQLYELEPLSYLNKYGVFENLSQYPGLEVLDGKKSFKSSDVNPLVLSLLDENLVLYSEDTVEQPVCWRHKTPVYYNATWQVFLKLEDPFYNLKEKVSTLLESSDVQPHYKERLESMLLSRPHWCLSRQRKWGCSMNLLVDTKTQTLHEKTAEYLSYLANGENVKAESLLTNLQKNESVELFTDVVDVWFDSGNVVNEFYNAHYKNKGLQKSYVVDLALEGKDQFRGWFQSSLWLSVAKNEVMPYKNLLCHGFVLNDKREKFAKSSGNAKVVDYYTDTFGADALHLWVASQDAEVDAVFSEKKLEEMKRLYSRLRLSLRFMTSNLYDYKYENHNVNYEEFKEDPSFDLHKSVLKELGELYQKMAAYFKEYNFKKALEELYLFSDKTLSNFYFELLKNNLYLRSDKQRLVSQVGLYEVLLNYFDCVKVFCPFVSEEFYQDYYNNGESVFYSNHLSSNYLKYNDLTLKYDWNLVASYRKEAQGALEPLQKEKLLNSRTEALVNLSCSDNDSNLLHSLSVNYKLNELLGVGQVSVNKVDKEEFLVEVVNLKQHSDYSKCPRCWNYEPTSTFEDELCHTCSLD